MATIVQAIKRASWRLDIRPGAGDSYAHAELEGAFFNQPICHFCPERSINTVTRHLAFKWFTCRQKKSLVASLAKRHR
jgi:hypothetical protein